jgi:5'-3' exonuclease
VKLPNRKKTYSHTLLVDGDSLLKTAYFGAKNLYNKDVHIGGIFQFLTMLRKIIKEYRFDRVYVFWDGRFSGRLRYDIYKEYKSNRGKDFYNETPPSDPDLYIQKERVMSYCEELFIRQYKDEIVEADDSIAYYVSKIKENEKVVILSNDRDLCQLIDDRVGMYVLNLRTIVTKDNYLKYFDHHPTNLKLIKMISGDNSDNIKGIQGISEKTIKKYFPEIVEKTLTLENIISKIDTIQNERKNRLKTLDNIINRVTVGVQGKDIYDINEKLINLKNPLLTESSKEELDYLFETTIDPEGREVKNVINMMIEDGLMMALPGGRDGYINFLQPFLRIIKKEKNYYLKTKTEKDEKSV